MSTTVTSRSVARELFEGTERVIGQVRARRQMAVLMERQQGVAEGLYERSQSAIVAGWTGVGKTYMTRMMCELCGLPFAEVNATQYTEGGYAGDDLAQMFVPLLESAAQMIDGEQGIEWPPIIGRRTDAEPSVLHRDDIDKVIERASTGVIFLDEMDKWTQRLNHATGRLDTAVQAELLKMVEGSVEYISDDQDELGVPFDTSKVLIICGGAFVGLARQVLRRLHRDEEYMHDEGFWDLIEQGDFVKYGLIPELAGRLGIHIFMRPLRTEHLAEILLQPEGLIAEYRDRFEGYGVDWDVPDSAVRHLANLALQKDVGARGVDNVLWHTFSDALFESALRDWPCKVSLRVNENRAQLAVG
jgi:ATP-dependent Clp protease ATP-binding subunit ClpX